MGHGKETPRQKMIGMMYLVLTALLALNVSKDAVEAFKKVDVGLTKTTANYIIKNNLTYEEFERAAAENPTKAGPWRDKAKMVKERADELFNYIQEIKIDIIREAEGPDTEALNGNEIIVEHIKAIDNTNVPSQILIGSDENGRANDLKALIADFRELLIEVIDGKNVSAEDAVRSNLSTSDVKNIHGETVRWENETFQALPLVAVITILSKIQVDVRNSEMDVINHLYSSIDASSFKFNKLVPIVTTNSNYIMQGNEYEAQVFISASDTTRKPVVMVGNTRKLQNADGSLSYEMVGDYQTLPVDDRGRGIFKVRAGTTGDKKWGGLINMKAPDGSDVFYPFESQYTVAVPNVVVSPTAMNVLYKGLDNPIDISVPGVGSDKISARMSNGSIRKGKYKNYRGEYIANPATVGQTAQIIVSAEVNGRQMTFPPIDFRVRSIPSPIAKFANLTEGEVPKAVAAAQQGVFAVLENFEFDLEYKVTSFTIGISSQGFTNDYPSSNNMITTAQREQINNLRRGQELIFKQIKAVGPDGIEKALPPIILKIN